MINTRYKTIMCKYYESDKVCPLGIKCHYSHGKEDMRKPNDPLPPNTPMMVNSAKTNPQQQNQGMPNPMSAGNFKTVICKYWEQGKCKYGTNCTFAHGDPEKKGAGMGGMGFNGGMQGQMPGYDPLKDPNIEYVMKLQQLNMIAGALSEIYPNDQTVDGYIRNAQQMLGMNNINQGAEILQKILYNNNVSEEKKKQHEEIVQSAKKFAENSYDMLRNGQVPEFMTAGAMGGMGGMGMPRGH